MHFPRHSGPFLSLFMVMALSSAPVQAQEIPGYTMVKGAFINGSGIGSAERGHTPRSCAQKCNAQRRCRSFEITEGWCSLNVTDRRTARLSLAAKYTYYERLSWGDLGKRPPPPMRIQHVWVTLNRFHSSNIKVNTSWQGRRRVFEFALHPSGTPIKIYEQNGLSIARPENVIALINQARRAGRKDSFFIMRRYIVKAWRPRQVR